MRRQHTREDYKDVRRLCWESIRRAEVQLNLSAAIEDSKKGLYKFINNKRRVKDVLHLSLEAGENIVTKHIEKAEVPNAFFALVFYCKTSCFPETERSVPENRDREQNKASTLWGNWSPTCHST